MNFIIPNLFPNMLLLVCRPNEENTIGPEEVPLVITAPNNGEAHFSPKTIGQSEEDLPFPMPGAIRITPAGIE